jgi:hypothetical protein
VLMSGSSCRSVETAVQGPAAKMKEKCADVRLKL